MDFDDIDELLLLLLVPRRPHGGQCLRTDQLDHEYVKELLDSAHQKKGIPGVTSTNKRAWKVGVY